MQRAVHAPPRDLYIDNFGDRISPLFSYKSPESPTQHTPFACDPNHIRVYTNMGATNDDADLAPSTAAGYKISEKKTVDEYAALDAKYILIRVHP
jgi:hypothetical protein